jgi:hypothetical protein
LLLTLDRQAVPIMLAPPDGSLAGGSPPDGVPPDGVAPDGFARHSRASGVYAPGRAALA